MITLRRVYDPDKSGEQFKVLIDRLWPRGIARGKADWHEWMKEIAPSDELRKWFNHDPARWEKFKLLYKEELSSKHGLLKRLLQLEMEHGTLTLVYSSGEERYNNAVALREILMQQKGQL